MFIVYELKLSGGKRYFGTTPKWRKDTRLAEHHAGTGSMWTQLYPPVKNDTVAGTWEVPTREEAYKFENELTEDYLRANGIDSARGGLCNFREPGSYKFWVRKHLRYLVPNEYKW